MLKLLAESHPGDVARLSLQYRMNQEICELSNEIVYKGALKCADDSVAGRRLHLSAVPGLPKVEDMGRWLLMAVSPQHPVVFIDTDCHLNENEHITSNESVGHFHALERTTGRGDGGSVVNDTEASIVRDVVAQFLSCGLAASNLGVVCPFRAQVNNPSFYRSWYDEHRLTFLAASASPLQRAQVLERMEITGSRSQHC